MKTTIERINELTVERLRLYAQASNGRRGDREVIARVKVIEAELARLWELRRQERAGHLDGIDQVVDMVYRQTYGADYEESVRPAPVMEPADDPGLRAAA